MKRLRIVPLDKNRRVIRAGNQTVPCEWAVCVGKRFSGKPRERRSFKRLDEAREFCRIKEAQRLKNGPALMALPHQDLIELAAAKPDLDALGLSVAEAIRLGTDAHRAQSKAALGKPLIVYRDAYLATKGKEAYRLAQSYSVDRLLRAFGDRSLHHIRTEDLDQWLNGLGLKPIHQRNVLRDARMFLRWVGKRMKIAHNPIDDMDLPPPPAIDVQVYTTEEVARILRAASKLGALPLYVFSFFAGTRVEELTGRHMEEDRRLSWDAIQLEQTEILMSGHISKTGISRNILVEPTLAAWIKHLGVGAGYIVGGTRKQIRKLRTAVHRLAGVPLKKNAMRHCYASYHAAWHRSPDMLRMQLGHETKDVLFRHYIALVSRRQAETYWSLLPDSVLRDECAFLDSA